MKQITLFLAAILLSLATLAQAPMGINYQTVIRDGDGNILPDTELSLQMTIRSGAPDGAVVYAETHEATTNAFGLVNLVIGYGSPLSNAFADINWGDDDKYLEIAIDLAGSGSYTIMGVTQFLSVIYAFHSSTTETYDETDPDFNSWDKSTGIAITENQITDLQDYLTAESDPEFNSWDKSTGIAITENQITDLQDYLTEEVDGDATNELQTLSQAGNTVTLSQGGGTISVADNDNLPANELQQISKVGSTVSLSQGGGSFTDAVNDADYNPGNELQTLVQNDLQVTLSQGGGTINIADNDNDASNEIQTVLEQDYNVSLSQGGGSFMTGVKSYTQAAIDAMIPYNGLVVFNTSTNCINYYNLNNWFEACGICTPQPTQAAAGDDQAFYDESTEATLAANTPEQGAGLWTVTSGEGGSFADATLPETTFTGQPCTAYILAWTISNSCGQSSDPVDITFFATPTVANAGNDTIVGGGATTLNLYANIPEFGEGLWTILSGEGGIIDDATNAAALFTGETGITYTLQWKIFTECAISPDEITVLFANIQIGEPYQGGIIAYILQPGDPGYVEGETHGIIAAASDQSSSAQWGCYGTSIPGADGTALGTGYQNTLDIVEGCSTAGIAAQICNDLELNGYTDWYLPSKDELNKLYLSKDLVGGFVAAYYWSSSGYSSYYAWEQYFSNGNQYTNLKVNSYYVRAVRAF